VSELSAGASAAGFVNVDGSGFDWGGYGRRGAIATKKRTEARVECASCGRRYSPEGKPHRCTRADLTTVPGKERQKHGNGHTFCACGRIKKALAPSCFRCGWREPGVFEDLDFLIASKVDTPRAELEAATRKAAAE